MTIIAQGEIGVRKIIRGRIIKSATKNSKHYTSQSWLRAIVRSIWEIHKEEWNSFTNRAHRVTKTKHSPVKKAVIQIIDDKIIPSKQILENKQSRFLNCDKLKYKNDQYHH